MSRGLDEGALEFVSTTGDEYRALCPLCIDKRGHPDTTGHLYVNVNKNVYYCVRCESGGHIYTKKGPSSSKREVVKGVSIRLVDYADLPPDTFNLRYLSDEHAMPYIKRAIDYLTSRTISITTAELYDLKVCTTGHFYDRLIVPVVMYNRLVYFIARSLDPNEKLRYLNPKNLPREGKIFNFDRAIKESTTTGKPIVVCEGVFSAIRTGTNAVATFGKDIDRTQAALLASTGLPITILFDEGAEQAALTAADRIYSWGAKVRIAECPKGEDTWVSEADKGKKADPACCSPEALDRAVSDSFEYVRLNSLDKMRCR